MADNKTTGKVKPRDGRDTEKIKGLDLMAALKWAKLNPWVLTVIALGGGTGGQEALAQFGQQVQWWQIALAVAAFAVFDLGARMLRRLDRIEERLADGSKVMHGNRGDIDSLLDWKREQQGEAAARNGEGK